MTNTCCDLFQKALLWVNFVFDITSIKLTILLFNTWRNKPFTGFLLKGCSEKHLRRSPFSIKFQYYNFLWTLKINFTNPTLLQILVIFFDVLNLTWSFFECKSSQCTHQVNTCSKLATKTLKQHVKYSQC